MEENELNAHPELIHAQVARCAYKGAHEVARAGGKPGLVAQCQHKMVEYLQITTKRHQCEGRICSAALLRSACAGNDSISLQSREHAYHHTYSEKSERDYDSLVSWICKIGSLMYIHMDANDMAT